MHVGLSGSGESDGAKGVEGEAKAPARIDRIGAMDVVEMFVADYEHNAELIIECLRNQYFYLEVLYVCKSPRVPPCRLLHHALKEVVVEIALQTSAAPRQRH